MRCPKCNSGEIEKQISIIGIFFKKKKVISFCSLCDFENEHIFKISGNDFEVEKIDRLSNTGLEKIKAKNTRKEISKRNSRYYEKRR